MRNLANEFVPGCDYTVVRLDIALVALVAKRAAACRDVRSADGSLAELLYWDASPECVGSPDPEKAESIEDALERGGGWTLLDDAGLGSFEPAKVDCTRMAVSAGDEPSVAWSCRVGSEPVRTIDVPLRGLGLRLGSPLGGPLRKKP